MVAVYDQSGDRGREDDGNETTATWIAATNVDFSRDVDATPQLRVRFVVAETGGVDNPGAVQFKLQYSLNGGAYTEVSTSSAVIRNVLSANFTSGSDCTQQISAGSFEADNNGMSESTTVVVGATWGAGEEIETEWMLEIQAADVVNGDTIDLRLYRRTPGLVALDVYSQTPRITVVKAGGVTPQTHQMLL